MRRARRLADYGSAANSLAERNKQQALQSLLVIVLIFVFTWCLALLILAVALAPKGIVVNAVSPGAVDTDALLAFPSRDFILGRARQVTPAGRIVTPEDVAKVVAWLCTEDAAMIVGQTITVDGGYSILA